MTAKSSQLSPSHKLAALFSAIYLTAVVNEWTTVKYVLKPTTTLLIAWPTLHGPSRTIFYGLLLSTLGDIFLMIPREDMFVPGLLSFLLAHILYIYSFDSQLKLSWTAIPLGLFSATMMRALYPGVANEDVVVQAGVAVYLLVITTMAYKASLSGNSTLIVGTLFFCVSDSILAWDKFLTSYFWCEFAVMFTYYAAQLCVAMAHC
ncbi:YhhN-like protein [Martensiomyces pterosporus]|nr:YhhN-like protein [Martensiomyces pterosporus]